jgi:hypothetical protein
MELLQYNELIKKHSWILESNKKCIISPDVDGILCGLFMSHYFDWKIVGYYDGKQLCIKKGNKLQDCTFLDMEIYRKEIKSIGQHMVLYNKNKIPNTWENFNQCINPNILRGFDASKTFQQKYPFGTIHLLLCIVRSQIEFSIPSSAITVLLYVDGTFKNLLNYPENCINWLHFLNAKNSSSPLSYLLNIFATQRISNMMHGLESIFKEFKEIGNGKKGGDKIKLVDIDANTGKFSESLKTKTQSLLSFLSNKTEWKFKDENWAMDELMIINLEKGIEQKLNNSNFTEILNKSPVSFAITGTKQLEYTKDHSIFNS